MESRAMSRSKIPTEAELERASALADERARHLDDVREAVLARFRSRGLQEFLILDQIDVDFRAYAFVARDADIEALHRSGLDRELSDFVYAELERRGRGSHDQIRVAFEFDSTENVDANFRGSYYLRAR